MTLFFFPQQVWLSLQFHQPSEEATSSNWGALLCVVSEKKDERDSQSVFMFCISTVFTATTVVWSHYSTVITPVCLLHLPLPVDFVHRILEVLLSCRMKHMGCCWFCRKRECRSLISCGFLYLKYPPPYLVALNLASEAPLLPLLPAAPLPPLYHWELGQHFPVNYTITIWHGGKSNQHESLQKDWINGKVCTPGCQLLLCNNFLLVSRVFAVWETELIGLCPCAEKLEPVYVSAAMAATGIYQLSWKIR